MKKRIILAALTCVIMFTSCCTQDGLSPDKTPETVMPQAPAAAAPASEELFTGTANTGSDTDSSDPGSNNYFGTIDTEGFNDEQIQLVQDVCTLLGGDAIDYKKPNTYIPWKCYKYNYNFTLHETKRDFFGWLLQEDKPVESAILANNEYIYASIAPATKNDVGFYIKFNPGNNEVNNPSFPQVVSLLLVDLKVNGQKIKPTKESEWNYYAEDEIFLAYLFTYFDKGIQIEEKLALDRYGIDKIETMSGKLVVVFEGVHGGVQYEPVTESTFNIKVER